MSVIPCLPGRFVERFRELQSILGLNQERCVHCHIPVDLGLDAAPALGPGGQRAPLCSLCAPHFAPYAGPRCPHCGEPGFFSGESPCPQCQGREREWDSVHFWGLYEGWLRDALLRFKFDNELAQGPFLAACLLQTSQCLPRPDVLLAIPQHKSRLRKRGCNHAHELAKHLARLGGFVVDPWLLARVQEGPLQHTLSGQARRSNLAGAFKATPAVQGLSIWLVDDIMTTGTTLAAAAKALREAGAVRVDCLVVARTPREQADVLP